VSKYVRIAPHPYWKALETCERISGCGVVIDTPNIAVDAVRIWPVGLDSYSNEAFLCDEPLRDFCTRPVALTSN
jgi:hypothetical protein